MLGVVRNFFAQRSVIEVDCLALNEFPAIDAHIDSMQVKSSPTTVSYLHTSPEYSMKKLLSEGSGDIFYLGHVFRQEEHGKLHHPEFTMIEWYRIDWSLDQLIKETIEVIQLFIPVEAFTIYTYKEIFEKHLSFDPHTASLDALDALSSKLGYNLHFNDRDSYLHLFLSHEIEPHLGNNELTIIQDYPPSQAALSQVKDREGQKVAERFEIYYRGIELANGYHELLCSNQQKERFEQENKKRIEMGKRAYSIDTDLLDALAQGLPDCSGVSVGFDRLLLLQTNRADIRGVLPIKGQPRSSL